MKKVGLVNEELPAASARRGWRSIEGTFCKIPKINLAAVWIVVGAPVMIGNAIDVTVGCVSCGHTKLLGINRANKRGDDDGDVWVCRTTCRDQHKGMDAVKVA
jgi:hypothetical protein